MVVNVASQCGFTPQYAGLELLDGKFRDQGFEILGVPCNQFAGQEPGNDVEIAEFCQRNFEKFLVNRDGVVVARFAPAVEPDSPEVLAAIEDALA